MAAAVKPKIPGMTITTEGKWRCNNCHRSFVTTPVCSGAHDDGSPCCGKAVCSHCADRCIRCRAYLCQDCFNRSKEGALCVQCPAPADGRAAYVNRQKMRAAAKSTTGTNGTAYDWRAESDRAYQAAAEAQQSVDDAMRRTEEIERSLEEMKARMRKAQEGRTKGGAQS